MKSSFPQIKSIFPMRDPNQSLSVGALGDGFSSASAPVRSHRSSISNSHYLTSARGRCLPIFIEFLLTSGTSGTSGLHIRSSNADFCKSTLWKLLLKPPHNINKKTRLKDRIKTSDSSANRSSCVGVVGELTWPQNSWKLLQSWIERILQHCGYY